MNVSQLGLAPTPHLHVRPDRQSLLTLPSITAHRNGPTSPTSATGAAGFGVKEKEKEQQQQPVSGSRALVQQAQAQQQSTSAADMLFTPTNIIPIVPTQRSHIRSMTIADNPPLGAAGGATVASPTNASTTAGVGGAGSAHLLRTPHQLKHHESINASETPPHEEEEKQQQQQQQQQQSSSSSTPQPSSHTHPAHQHQPSDILDSALISDILAQSEATIGDSTAVDDLLSLLDDRLPVTSTVTQPPRPTHATCDSLDVTPEHAHRCMKPSAPTASTSVVETSNDAQVLVITRDSDTPVDGNGANVLVIDHCDEEESSSCDNFSQPLSFKSPPSMSSSNGQSGGNPYSSSLSTNPAIFSAANSSIVISGVVESETTLCAVCEQHRAELYCQDCDMLLCTQGGCNRTLHAPKKNRGHTRLPLQEDGKTPDYTPGLVRPGTTANGRDMSISMAPSGMVGGVPLQRPMTTALGRAVMTNPVVNQNLSSPVDGSAPGTASGGRAGGRLQQSNTLPCSTPPRSSVSTPNGRSGPTTTTTASTISRGASPRPPPTTTKGSSADSESSDDDDDTDAIARATEAQIASVVGVLCDQCQLYNAVVYCLDCASSLCDSTSTGATQQSSCNKRIHKARHMARHRQVKIEERDSVLAQVGEEDIMGMGMNDNIGMNSADLGLESFKAHSPLPSTKTTNSLFVRTSQHGHTMSAQFMSSSSSGNSLQQPPAAAHQRINSLLTPSSFVMNNNNSSNNVNNNNNNNNSPTNHTPKPPSVARAVSPLSPNSPVHARTLTPSSGGGGRGRSGSGGGGGGGNVEDSEFTDSPNATTSMHRTSSRSVSHKPSASLVDDFASSDTLPSSSPPASVLAASSTVARSCDNCDTNLACVYCVECAQYLCTEGQCQQLIHKPTKMKSHQMFLIAAMPSATSNHT